MSRLASQILILGLIALMGLIYGLTLHHPQQDLILSGAALGLIALSLTLEHLRPLHQGWNRSQGDLAGDLGSFVLIFGLLDSALKALTPFVLLALLPGLGKPLDAPLWAQILLATLLIEGGAWLSHWAHHRFAPLWALHAMHHSTTRLYTMNNFRFHPLNHILNHLLLFAPALIVGIPPQAILGYAALSLPVLLFQHSNVGFDFGALNRVLNTNDVHRWHHSSDPRDGIRNLGRALVLFDRLFGTYHCPKTPAQPRHVGLFANSATYPGAARFMAQILWPFSRDCCRTGAG